MHDDIEWGRAAREPTTHLRRRLAHAVDVAERAQAVRAALRHHIRALPQATQFEGRAFHHGPPLGVVGVRDQMDLRPREAIEEDIPVARQRLQGVIDPEEQDAPQPERRANERGRARMVRLKSAAGDDGVSASPNRVTEEPLELAHLVAGLGAAGHVVALDPQVDPEELIEPSTLHDGRRTVHECDARQLGHRGLRRARPG